MKKAIFINIYTAEATPDYIFRDGGLHTLFFSDGFASGISNIIAINPRVISFKFDSDANNECVKDLIDRASKCNMLVEKIERFVKPTVSAQ